MAKTLVAVPLVSLIKIYTNIMLIVILFFNIEINTLKIYYQFTTFESENIKNYNNICEYLSK